MMEANKDAAEQCVVRAEAALLANDTAGALRLLVKGKSLYPLAGLEAKIFAVSCKADAMGTASVPASPGEVGDAQARKREREEHVRCSPQTTATAKTIFSPLADSACTPRAVGPEDRPADPAPPTRPVPERGLGRKEASAGERLALGHGSLHGHRGRSRPRRASASGVRVAGRLGMYYVLSTWQLST